MTERPGVEQIARVLRTVYNFGPDAIESDAAALYDAGLRMADSPEPYRCGGPQSGQPRPHTACNCSPLATTPAPPEPLTWAERHGWPEGSIRDEWNAAPPEPDLDVAVLRDSLWVLQPARGISAASIEQDGAKAEKIAAEYRRLLQAADPLEGRTDG